MWFGNGEFGHGLIVLETEEQAQAANQFVPSIEMACKSSAARPTRLWLRANATQSHPALDLERHLGPYLECRWAFIIRNAV